VLAQQPRRERLQRAAHLRALQLDRAGGGLDRGVAVAVAHPGPGTLPAGVAVPAEELGHLGLQRGLEHQPDAEPGDLLEDLAKLTLGVGEQAVDLGSDTIGCSYSLR
jgi:hypothetical protein